MTNPNGSGNGPEAIEEESDHAPASPPVAVALGDRGDRVREADDIVWTDVGTHDPTLLLAVDEATSGRVHALAGLAKRAGVSGPSSDCLGEPAVHDGMTNELVDPASKRVSGLVSTKIVSKFGDAFEVNLNERGDQVVASGEVPVESTDTDSCRTGDLVERRRNPVAPECVVSSTEKAAAVAAGIGTEVVHLCSIG